MYLRMRKNTGIRLTPIHMRKSDGATPDARYMMIDRIVMRDAERKKREEIMWWWYGFLYDVNTTSLVRSDHSDHPWSRALRNSLLWYGELTDLSFQAWWQSTHDSRIRIWLGVSSLGSWISHHPAYTSVDLVRYERESISLPYHPVSASLGLRHYSWYQRVSLQSL